MDRWKLYGPYLPQMMMMLVLMMVTAADGCGDADVSLPRVSFGLPGQERVGWLLIGGCTPANDIRSENIRVYSSPQVHFLQPLTPPLLSALCCFHCTFFTRSAVWLFIQYITGNALLNHTWSIQLCCKTDQWCLYCNACNEFLCYCRLSAP